MVLGETGAWLDSRANWPSLTLADINLGWCCRIRGIRELHVVRRGCGLAVWAEEVDEKVIVGQVRTLPEVYKDGAYLQTSGA
jgi:hypothetical protein